MTKTRTILAVALAAGTFGGTVGALAASAVQSQASPEAIAAAVKKVSDSSAERSLRSINAKLGTLDADLNPNTGELLQLASGEGSNFRTLESDLAGVRRNIDQICENTAPQGQGFTLCTYENP